MLSVLGFLVILGPLVIVHEFGHYIFARIFGVKAEIFSVGFGPRLWFRQMGETELRLSAIPLGGYVKLLGEEPGVELSPEDKKRALQNADAWKRFFIFFGGPLFNFLFAIVVFMAILLIGEPKLANYVGRVEQGSEAARVGLVSGDQILKVNGKEVKKFNEIFFEIRKYPADSVQLEVRREGVSKPFVLTVPTGSEEGYSQYGEVTDVGTLEGVHPVARGNATGVSQPDSPAGKAGVQTGDRILKANGVEMGDWERLAKFYHQLGAGRTFQVELEREKGKTFTAEFKKPAESQGLGNDLGLHPTELFVERLVEESPAVAAGLLKGDRIIGVNGAKAESFFDLKKSIQKFGESDGKVNVTWERSGQVFEKTLEPTKTQQRDAALRKSEVYTIGFYPMVHLAEPNMVVERILNPFMLLYEGTRRMLDFTWRNLVSIGKMVTGKVSVATLGGPILIGKLAGDSLAKGLISFLNIMAILSVGLGILNVLPIPVLDGGHLLLLGIEMVRGKPLSIRQIEILQQVGLSLILLLMIVVIRNDLARLPIFN